MNIFSNTPCVDNCDKTLLCSIVAGKRWKRRGLRGQAGMQKVVGRLKCYSYNKPLAMGEVVIIHDDASEDTKVEERLYHRK